MARPFKARRVCSQPMVEVFGPLDQDAATRVELTLEEYETIPVSYTHLDVYKRQDVI